MKHLKKTPFFLLIFLVLFILAGLDPRLQVTCYTYKSSEIPSSFHRYKICQISDLHCKTFGENNQILLQKIKDISPNIVVLTGDIVDEDHSDLSSIEALFCGLNDLKIPTYYITGNHETEDAPQQYEALQDLMDAYGITDLDDKTETIALGDDSISLTGSRWYARYVVQYLKPAEPEGFHILLYHGADFFDLIDSYNYDLVLAGHIHGGIIRIPFLDIGLFGNLGDLFPKYSSGIYQSGTSDCTMIVSRGLGDSRIPRFYNRPELVCITLESTAP